MYDCYLRILAYGVQNILDLEYPTKRMYVMN